MTEAQRLAEEAKSNLRALGAISLFRDKLDREVAGDLGEKIEAALDRLAALQADQARDAARYRWLAAQARTEDRDGGYTGFWRLPYIDGWNDTPYAHNRGEGFNFRSDFAAALDAAMATKEVR